MKFLSNLAIIVLWILATPLVIFRIVEDLIFDITGHYVDWGAIIDINQVMRRLRLLNKGSN